MHGCVEHGLGDIVLTRENFFGYAEKWAALAGVVQAMMLTRHLLFVGFSLDDYNFQRIAYAVGQVLRRAGDGCWKSGTALMLGRNELVAALWERELNSVPMSEMDEAEMRVKESQTMEATPKEENQAPSEIARAARRLEIFLDYLLARVHSATYLLDPRFDRLLNEHDKELAANLRGIARGTEPAARKGPLWQQFTKFLRELGADAP